MSDPSGRVMQAMMKMTKLDIQKLQDAYDGK
jgi:predicted 3-demethylubiquinone-9 3-methyltransferase (glyoxalase superfamily)